MRKTAIRIYYNLPQRINLAIFPFYGNMSTKTIIAMLAIVALVGGGVAAVTGTMSQAYAYHQEGIFPTQGKCIQYANSFKNSDVDEDGDVDEDDLQEVRDFINDYCKRHLIV